MALVVFFVSLFSTNIDDEPRGSVSWYEARLVRMLPCLAE